MATSTGRDQAEPRPVDNTVNGALTPNADVRSSRTPSSAHSPRASCAHSRRIATGEVESLTHMIKLSDDVNDAVQLAVDGLRPAGYSWTEIGDRLGVTRQAAQQRWGRALGR